VASGRKNSVAGSSGFQEGETPHEAESNLCYSSAKNKKNNSFIWLFWNLHLEEWRRVGFQQPFVLRWVRMYERAFKSDSKQEHAVLTLGALVSDFLVQLAIVPCDGVS
jgi:hypothetical protein